jgi:hypothetical protein
LVIDEQSNRATLSPPPAVLLLPVAISKKEGSNSYYLASTGNFQLNLVLLHLLEDQFKLKLHPEDLLAEFAGDEDEGSVLDIKGLCEKIQRGMADARGPSLA